MYKELGCNDFKVAKDSNLICLISPDVKGVLGDPVLPFRIW
jgi:hypothetical protein